MVWKLVQGSGVMTTDDAVEVTNDATTSAIESVQTVTSFFHLPTWFGRLIFILIVVLLVVVLLIILVVILLIVILVRHKFTSKIYSDMKSDSIINAFIIIIHKITAVFLINFLI